MANTTGMITVTPNASIHDVLQKMQSNFIKHIIVESKNKPVGIVTERDIGKFLENDKTSRALEEISIEQVMEKNIITVADGGNDSVYRAAKLMSTFKIGSVIIVDSNGDLAGVITKMDIAKVYGVVYGAKFKVKDHMSSKVFTCRESDSIRFALNTINQNDISRLVVTNNNGKPLGVITTNTFLKHSSYFTKDETKTCKYLLPEDSENALVGDFVRKELLTVNPEDDLSIAAQRMIKNHIHGIPVTDNAGRLIGIVSDSDIADAFVRVPLNDKLLQEYPKLY